MVYKSMWQANIYIEEINMRSVSEDDSRADWLRKGGISADIATREIQALGESFMSFCLKLFEV